MVAVRLEAERTFLTLKTRLPRKLPPYRGMNPSLARFCCAARRSTPGSPSGERLGLRHLTAQLLINRGVRDEQEARRYLDPRLSDPRPPEGVQPMAAFAVAVERLKAGGAGSRNGGRFGDYDVDGITTCALLTDFLNRAGVTVAPRVAHRGDGYGFGKSDAHELAHLGCDRSSRATVARRTMKRWRCVDRWAST